MRYVKRSFILILVVVMLFNTNITMARAYDYKEHNKILESILLGRNKNIKSLPENGKTAMEGLEEAVSITLDQYNGECGDRLDSLNSKVTGLPESITVIDFTEKPEKHRAITHLAWQEEKSSDYRREKCKWPVRKFILMETVAQLWTDNKNKGEAFAKLVYYIHILADYKHDLKKIKQKLSIKDNEDENVDLSALETVDEYNVKSRTAEYIAKNKSLPEEYITKEEAKNLGWNEKSRNTLNIDDMELKIGGDEFPNDQNKLPELVDGKKYYECYLYDENGTQSESRLIYTNDGVVYYTNENYTVFCLLYPEVYGYNKENAMVGIGGRSDKVDILTELIKTLDVLFADQKRRNSEYMELTRILKTMNKDMRKLVKMKGDLSTNGRRIKYLGYAVKILDILKDKIPWLLDKEEFFTSTLYKETP